MKSTTKFNCISSKSESLISTMQDTLVKGGRYILYPLHPRRIVSPRFKDLKIRFGELANQREAKPSISRHFNCGYSAFSSALRVISKLCLVALAVLFWNVHGQSVANAQSLKWLDGFDGIISAAGNSMSYPYQVAGIGVTVSTKTVDPQAPISETFTTVEVAPNESDKTSTGKQGVATGFDLTKYPEVNTGDTNPIELLSSNFSYGDWYVKQNVRMGFTNIANRCDQNIAHYCNHILFVPNASAINQMTVGDTVTSTLTYTLQNESSELVSRQSLTVRITRTSISTITVESLNQTVKGGLNTEFAVFADPAPSSPLTVSLDVEATPANITGVATATKEVTIPANHGTVIFSQSTNAVATGSTGTVDVSINAGTAYAIGTTSSARTTVNNEDVVLLSLFSANGNDALLTEGTHSSLTFNISGEPRSSDIAVKVKISETGDVIDSQYERIHMVTLPMGGADTSVDLPPIPINDDNADEADSTITATLVPDPSYRGQANDSSAIFLVSDDDEPSISISPVTQSVTEGTAAQFKIAVDPPSHVPMTVNYTLSQTADSSVIATTPASDLDVKLVGANTIEIPANQSEVIVSVATESDDEFEPSANIGVSIDAADSGTSYSVGATSSAQVEVKNDDFKPVISISVDRHYANVGVDYRVTISSDKQETITVSVTEGHYNAAGGEIQTATRQRVLTNGTIELLLQTSSNMVARAEYAIAESENYEIDPENSSIEIHYVSSTRPGVSVSAVSEEINVGESATFNLNLTASPNRTVEHIVNLSWNTAGLVTSIGCAGTSGAETTVSETAKSHACTVTMNSTETTLPNTRLITVATKFSAADSMNDTIMASLKTDQDFSSLTNPTYQPIFNPSASTVTIPVNEPGIDWSWDGGNFNGTVLVSGFSNSTYGSHSLTLTVRRVGTTTIDFVFEEQKEQETPNTSSAFTSNNITHRDWTVMSSDSSGDTNKITTVNATFNASSGNAIQGLAPGETRTAKMTVTQKLADNTVLNTESITVTLRRPDYAVNFAGGENTAKIISTKAGSYPDLQATSIITNNEGTNANRISNDFSVSEDASFLMEVTARISSFESINGTNYGVASSGLRYGSWLLDVFTGHVIFRPNATAIDMLESKTQVTSTATLTLSNTNTTKTLTVTMERPLVLSISPGSTVSEATGALATFTVTSNVNPEDMIEVNYTATATSDFLLPPDPNDSEINGHVSGEPKTASMSFTDQSQNQDGTGPFVHLLEITLQDNNRLDSGPQSVTVALNEDSSGTDYLISTSESSATVTVIDSETLPVLSIEASGNGESNENANNASAGFMITATIPAGVAPPASFDFRFTPTQDGNFINDSSGNFTPDAIETDTFVVTGSGNSRSHMLNVPIDNDANPEATGSISVEILTDGTSNAKYKLDTSKNSATVKVFDDEAPELSISVLPKNERVLEGSSASVSFRVTVRISPDEIVMVDYLPTENGGPYLQANGKQTANLDFSGGLLEVDFSVPISSDSIQNSDSEITVVLQNEATLQNYFVDEDNNTAKITVVDDDGAPQISITAPMQPVLESTDGTTASIVTFEIKSTRASSNMRVNYTVSEVDTGDFLANSEEGDKNKILTFTDEDLVEEITVTLDNDDIGERTGMISVTLKAPNNAIDYSIDNPTSETPVAALATIWDDDAPELSISAGADVFESVDEFAAFEISAHVMPKTTLSIDYTPVSSDFLSPGKSGELHDENPPLTFGDPDGDGTYTATLNVPIYVDPVKNADGSIIVTLADDDSTNPTYFVKEASKTATVNVMDDSNVPRLSISGPDKTAEYADMLTFTVTATAVTKPEDNFRVFYSLTQNGSFLHSDHTDLLNENNSSTELEFTGATPTFTAQMNFQLDNDSEGEDDGFVKVTINSVAGGESAYLVSESNEHTITVLDDDRPVIWITVLDANRKVNEGEEARFTVKSVVLPSTNPLLVSYRIADTNFIADTSKGDQTTQLTFVEDNGEYAAPLNIPLLENANSNTHGLVMATLVQNSPATYVVETDNRMRPKSATVQVLVENSAPAVFITRAEELVVEGQSLRFSIQVIPAQNESVSATLNWHQDGDFIFTVLPQSVIIPEDQTVEVSVPTVDDNVIEEDGSVTLVAEITGTLQSTAESTVTVEDNDDSNSTARNLYSVSANVITSILLEIPATSAPPKNQKVYPQVTITPVSNSIHEGESAEFSISSDKFAGSETTVNVELEQKGEFLNGPMTRSVNISEGESEVLLFVGTDNDEVAEEDGQITATIMKGDGYIVGLQNVAWITVIDEKDRQKRKLQITNAVESALPDLLVFSTVQSFETVSGRVTQSFDGNNAASVLLNGQSAFRSIVQTNGRKLNSDNMDWQSVIDDSSFTLALYPEFGGTNPATIWGIGDHRNISSMTDTAMHDWKGEMSTGHFGIDSQLSEDFLTGVAISISKSELNFSESLNKEFLFDVQTTGFHPYIGYSSSEGSTRLEIMTGYGVNEFELRQEEYSPVVLNGSYQTVGFGGNNQLYSNKFGKELNFELNSVGEIWHTQQFVSSNQDLIDNLQMNAGHARIAIDGTINQEFATGEAFSPSISIGIRRDVRNDASTTGYDIKGGFKYLTFNGLEATGSGQVQLSGLNRTNGWKIESSLNYDSENDDKGVLFNISPAWSGVGTNTYGFHWNDELFGVSSNSVSSSNGRHLESQFGYGFEIWDENGILTPYIGVNLLEQKKSYNSGISVGIGSNMEFGFEGQHQLENDSASIQKARLFGNIIWHTPSP